MKAVIIGSTLEGLGRAISLRQEGWDVTLLACGTYLLQDITETWRDYPLSRQPELHSRLTAFTNAFHLPLPDEGILTPVQIKRTALQWMRAADINVRYQTRVLGISLHAGRLCGVVAADTTGLFHQPCERIIDALPYRGGAAAVSGKPIVFPSGCRVTVRLELTNAACQEDTVLPNGVTLLPGAMGPGHVFAEKLCSLPQQMTLAQLRRYSTALTDEVLASLPREHRSCAQARAGTALPLCPDADAALPPAFSMEGWNEGTGISAKPDSMLIAGVLMPWQQHGAAPVIPFEWLPEKRADVCVVGMGTAGVWAAIAARSQNVSVIGTDMMPFMGGTRTLGGVTGRYYGNRSRFFARITDQLTAYAKRFQPTDSHAQINAVTEMLYYNAAAETVDFCPCSLACAVQLQNHQISRVLLAGEEGAFTVSASQYIDATGNGALSFLCGCSFDVGDECLGITQNYSQWNRCACDSMGTRSIDQDTMDDTLPDEWTRALENNLITAREYDLYDCLTVRESRRIRGRMRITLEQVFRETHYADALCEAYSTYDPHGRCLHLWGRLGLMPALGKARYVSIPLRAVTVHEAQNLMIAGKAISCDQDAFNYIRMSADVAALGWIEGCIAAKCLQGGYPPALAPLCEIQQKMYEAGVLSYLPGHTDEDTVSPARLISGTLCGNRQAFHEAMITAYPETETLLLEAHRASDGVLNDLGMRLMLFYGHTEYASILHDKLRQLIERCGTIIYSDHQNDDGVSRCGMVNDQPDAYWEMNQLVTLLVKARYEPIKASISAMLNNTVPGGAWLNDASDYARIRLDCQTIPNFDRILCLAECIIQMPSSEFIPALQRIYDQTYASPIFDSPFYKEFLLYKIAYALQCCKEEHAPQPVFHHADMSASRYAVLRRNAKANLL